MRAWNTILMELHGLFIPPLSSYLRFVDTVPERNTRNTILDIITGIFVGGAMLIWAPICCLAKFQEAISRAIALSGEEDKRRRAIEKQIEDNPMYKFGAPRSLRRRSIGRVYNHYFQSSDKMFYEQSVWSAIIRGYIDYLDECGIDTSEL